MLAVSDISMGRVSLTFFFLVLASCLAQPQASKKTREEPAIQRAKTVLASIIGYDLAQGESRVLSELRKWRRSH